MYALLWTAVAAAMERMLYNDGVCCCGRQSGATQRLEVYLKHKTGDYLYCENDNNSLFYLGCPTAVFRCCLSVLYLVTLPLSCT